ncbi:MAG: hypothetical protein U0Y82_06075 [Thermoleophilia bacterium]
MVPREARFGEDATRQELYERARRAGVPGRSGMSKAQLEAALERVRHREEFGGGDADGGGRALGIDAGEVETPAARPPGTVGG